MSQIRLPNSKVRQHGVGKRRPWRQVHFAVDADHKEVIGVAVTPVEWADGEGFEGLLEPIEGEIAQVDGAGAYDTGEGDDAGMARDVEAGGPPRENAVPWEADPPRPPARADIAEPGVAGGKESSGSHRRSLAENARDRFKQRFGDDLASRLFATQVTEVQARVAAMNIMTYLGRPVSGRGGVPAS